MLIFIAEARRISNYYYLVRKTDVSTLTQIFSRSILYFKNNQKKCQRHFRSRMITGLDIVILRSLKNTHK